LIPLPTSCYGKLPLCMKCCFCCEFPFYDNTDVESSPITTAEEDPESSPIKTAPPQQTTVQEIGEQF